MNDATNNDDDAQKQIRGSTLLLVGRLLALLINLAVQVLIVRYLSKTDYGAFAFAIVMVTLATNVSIFGLNKSLARFVSIYHEREEFGRMAGTIIMVLATVAGIGVAIVLCVFTFQSAIADHVVSSPSSAVLLLALIALAPIDAIDAILRYTFGAFGAVRTVFFRRHIVGPTLRLLAVLAVILFQGSVHNLAIYYVIAGVAGVLLYVVALIGTLRREDLLKHFRPSKLEFPVREVFGFNTPLVVSQLSMLFRGSLVVLMLEMMLDSTAVAEYRAVLPFARLNLVVITSFTFLFTPLASRMLARSDKESINCLYWTSCIWVAVLTLPLLLITSVFAEPLTLFMLGDRYASSSVILTLLAIGFFADAAFGFAVQTLRVHAKLRYILLTDVTSILWALGLLFYLIPRYGATGAAISAASTMVFQNVSHMFWMRRTTGYGAINWRYAKVYIGIAGVVAILLAIQLTFHPPLAVDLVLIAIASLVLVYANRELLEADRIFPELLRLPIVGRMLVPASMKQSETTL